MLVDGVTTDIGEGNSIISWAQQFNVEPDETYQFSFYFTTLFDAGATNPCKLSIKLLSDEGYLAVTESSTGVCGKIPSTEILTGINDDFNLFNDNISTNQPITLNEWPHKWHHISGVWTNNSYDHINIAVISEANSESDGNDFGIDDISFRKACASIETPSGNWSSTVSTSGGANILTGTFSDLAENGCTGSCSVVLTDQSGTVNYNNIVSFTNLRALSTDPQQFVITAIMNDNTEVDLVGSVSCYDLFENCNETNFAINHSFNSLKYIKYNINSIGNTVNPFIQSILGNWKAKKSYAYVTTRDKAVTAGHTDIRRDGTFSTFKPFWNYNTSGNWLPVYNSSSPDYNSSKPYDNWQWTSEVTKSSPAGFEVENVDPLGRYNSAQYGYMDKLPVAVANNSRYNEMGYDGFEDYNFYGKLNQHFNFKASYPDITYGTAHTGWNSITLAGCNNSTELTKSLNSVCTTSATQIPYRIRCEDQLGSFAPDIKTVDQKYVISGWVSVKDATTVSDYNNANINVLVDGNPVTVTKTTKGAIIEGWQRVEKEFIIPANSTTNITLKLEKSGSQSVFFDDIRCHPFNSTMKSFVYDPVSFRLMAELDENNYATLYEYNPAGQLIRVKKETEKGIMTIKEYRNNEFNN